MSRILMAMVAATVVWTTAASAAGEPARDGALLVQAGERPCGRDDCAAPDSGDGQSSGMTSWENRGAERRPRDCDPRRGGGMHGRMMDDDARMNGRHGRMEGGAHRMESSGMDASGRRFGMHAGAMRSRNGTCAGDPGEGSSERFIGK